jgi:hypothetical protein
MPTNRIIEIALLTWKKAILTLLRSLGLTSLCSTISSKPIIRIVAKYIIFISKAIKIKNKKKKEKTWEMEEIKRAF